MLSPTDSFKNKECIFCKITAGTLPSEKVYENEHVFAFRDISPQAPVHVLIVPKQHVIDVLDVSGENAVVFQHLFRAVQHLLPSLGLQAQVLELFSTVAIMPAKPCITYTFIFWAALKWVGR